MWSVILTCLRGVGKQWFFACFLSSFSLALLFHPSTMAQGPIQQARLTQVLDSPQVFIQNRQAKVNDQATKGQQIRTQTARAELKFNTGAIGRLSHHSVLTVGQCARLRQGTLLVNGAINGCTASVVAGVRGTTYVLAVEASGETQVKVLEGAVTVTPAAFPAEPDEDAGEDLPKEKQFGIPSISDFPWLNPEPAPTPTPSPEPVPPNAQPDGNSPPASGVVVRGGEKVIVSPTGAVGLVLQLTQEDFINLLRGDLFTGFTRQIPGLSKIQQTFQRLFPGVPFPLSIPGLPRLPIPIRLPF